MGENVAQLLQPCSGGPAQLPVLLGGVSVSLVVVR